MTREEQIKAIYEKIAKKADKKSSGDFTSYYGIWCKPVLIGDLLHYIYTQRIEILGRPFEFKKILDLWEYKREPIEEQSDETIDYLYNLIKE